MKVLKIGCEKDERHAETKPKMRFSLWLDEEESDDRHQVMFVDPSPRGR